MEGIAGPLDVNPTKVRPPVGVPSAVRSKDSTAGSVTLELRPAHRGVRDATIFGALVTPDEEKPIRAAWGPSGFRLLLLPSLSPCIAGRAGISGRQPRGADDAKITQMARYIRSLQRTDCSPSLDKLAEIHRAYRRLFIIEGRFSTCSGWDKIVIRPAGEHNYLNVLCDFL